MTIKKFAKPAIPLLTLVAMLAGYGIKSWGQNPGIEYRWTPPTSGSTVVEYRGYLTMWNADGDTVRTTIEHIPATATDGYVYHRLSYQYGWTVTFAVAGIDANTREGPRSVASTPWRDDGPPGQPGPVEQTLVF